MIPYLRNLNSETINYFLSLGISANVHQSIFLNKITDATLCQKLLELGANPLDRRYDILIRHKSELCRKLMLESIDMTKINIIDSIFLKTLCSCDISLPKSNLVVGGNAKIIDRIGRAGEDDHICLVSNGQSHIDFLYAVFDGHGGEYRCKKSGKVVCDNHIVNAAKNGGYDDILPLHHYIEIYTQFYSDVEEAIQKAFIDFDTQAHHLGYNYGSCVTMLLSIKGELYSVNLGDSRVIISNGENLLFETQDHEPENEIERIVSAGGYVVSGRVCGSLAVSRSLLDRELKGKPYNAINGMVSALPDVVKLNLPPGPKTAIISSDAPFTSVPGCYTSLELITKMRQLENLELLADEIRKFSSDDITLIVVDLN